MSWILQINASYDTAKNADGCASKAAFFPAASVDDIARAEARLKVTLPQSLRSLLLETNGVMAMLSVNKSNWFENMWLIFPIDEIVAENSRYRAGATDRPYQDNLHQVLFFAGAGCDGILFGFPMNPDLTCEQSVVVWHPMRDTLSSTAESLDAFIVGWLDGTIKV